MKYLIVGFVFFSSLYSFGQFVPKQLYQVIETHPEKIRRISGYVQTEFKGGRLWTVRLKSNHNPEWLFRSLRPVLPHEVAHYTPNRMDLSNVIVDPIDLKFLAEIDLLKLKSNVNHLSSYKNRYAGTADNKAAQAWIESQLRGLGFLVTTICYQPGSCSVIADKKGSTNLDQVIMVEAHFDSVGRDFAGADDNGTGSAATLEIARVLKNYDNKKTIRFFLTNGEEGGLLGATHYAQELARAGLDKQLKLVINMDMIGYNSNGIVELETNPEYKSLAEWFAALTFKYTTLTSKITLNAWGSDHVPFLELHIPTLLTIEDWNTKTPCYHKACDLPETVNYKYMTEITKLNTAAVLTKDAE